MGADIKLRRSTMNYLLSTEMKLDVDTITNQLLF